MKILVHALFLLLLPALALGNTAVRDTLDLYGGPGTLEGKFQTAAGEPDPQGWVAVDETVPPPTDHWRISTLLAANLDPTVPDNHAWFCGAEFEACGELDSPWGYGNDWNDAIGTSLTVDPDSWATLHLTGVLNLDLEPGYDYLFVEALTVTGPVTLAQLDGVLTTHVLDVSHTWQPGEFVGEAGDEIAVRLVVATDEGWSDEDCQYPTSGAVQVDNLTTEVTQDGGPGYPLLVETCEPGDPSRWGPVEAATGVGCFAQLWTGLDDMDPDRDNPSPQWAFVNDGEIVPELDPSYCWVKCYGPDSLSIYTDPPAWRNSIVSPEVELPAGWTGELLLGFDAYNDQAMCFTTFLRCSLAWTADETGAEGWTEAWYPYMIYSAGPQYGRVAARFGNDLVPNEALRVRIKLQLDAPRINLCWGPMDSPAPYLDNVRLQLLGPYESDVPPGRGFVCSAAPNPFNPNVVIRWEMPQAGDLEVRILDVRGRQVRTLRSGRAAAGPGQSTWRGRDDTGREVAAGIYLCRVGTADQERWLKLTLLK